MLSTSELLEKIDRFFPYVKKPSADEITVHKKEEDDDCRQCDHLRRALAKESNSRLTDGAIRSVAGDLYLLSAKGFRWFLSHYLKRCVTQEPEWDNRSLDSLIYFLSGYDDNKADYKAEATATLSTLSADQLVCLLHVIEWYAQNPMSSFGGADDIASAMRYVGSLVLRPNAVVYVDFRRKPD